MDHVSLQQYLRVLDGDVRWEDHLRACQQHLLDLCPTCRQEWQGGGGELMGVDAGGSSEPGARPGPDDRDYALHVRHADIEAEEERLSRMRDEARLARVDLRRVLALPPSEWQGKVERAHTRYQSPAFAALLIEESRARVRTCPDAAYRLAGLVPVALCRDPEVEVPPWARALLLRARAHGANALRIQGDLRAAESAFRGLREELLDSGDEALSTAESAVKAEVLSLEASCNIDARQFVRAEARLGEAADLQRESGDREGLVRILIQHANLLGTLGRPAALLTLLEEAMEATDAEEHPFLVTCAVTGRINALCDLDRADEAHRLLEDHSVLFLEAEDDHSAATFRLLRARVALGRGRVEAAVDGFTRAREDFLALDRGYDAILVSLHLADALLAAGEVEELRKLAGDLVPQFEAQGVAREALASLRLLVEAIRAEQVTSAYIAELRTSLVGGV